MENGRIEYAVIWSGGPPEVCDSIERAELMRQSMQAQGGNCDGCYVASRRVEDWQRVNVLPSEARLQAWMKLEFAI